MTSSRRQKYINNQFDVVSILKGPGGKRFDSSSANQAYTHLFQSLGLMAPISATDVPSLAKMYPFFQDSPIWRWAPAPDTYNSVPWTWGAIGINYLTDNVEQARQLERADRSQEQRAASAPTTTPTTTSRSPRSRSASTSPRSPTQTSTVRSRTG